MAESSAVRKGWRQNAKVSDAVGLAEQAALPARVGARFALIIALVAFLVSAIALGVAVTR